MNTETKSERALLIYTEQTPNPDSLKFVTNRMIYQGLAEFKTKELASEWSPLAAALFEKECVKSVYIANNYVTISRAPGFEWHEIMIDLKEFIKDFMSKEEVIVKDGYEVFKLEQEKENIDKKYEGKEAEIVLRIKELITHYVKPAVEMDGGNIEFRDFTDGIVTVALQGSCSGCPSSSVTLKAGIEGMLKRMIPEVKEVVAQPE